MPKPATPLTEMRVNGTDLKLQNARLVSLLYVHTFYSPDKLWVVARDLEWSYFDGFLEEDAEVNFRLGVETEEEQRWSDERKLVVSAAQPGYHPDMIEMTAMCEAGAAEMNHTCSRKIFTDKRISEMVQELADESGIDTQIEQTEGKFSLCQGCLTDGAFVRQVLLPLAYNSSRYDYLCYTKSGMTLVFEPPDLGSEKAELLFPGENKDFGSLDLVTCYYRPFWQKSTISSSLRVRGVDPLKKETGFSTADDDSVNYETLASKKPSAPESPGTVLPVQFPGRDSYQEPEIEDIAKSIWCGRLRELWIVPLKTVFSPNLEVVELKGAGKIQTFTTCNVAPEGREDEVPYTILLVELDEGPWVMGNLIDFDPEKATIESLMGKRVKMTKTRVFSGDKYSAGEGASPTFVLEA